MAQKIFILHAVQAIEVRTGLSAKAIAVVNGGSCYVVIGGADPQAHLPPFAQPMRQADVVGVHMGDDHTQNGQAL
ncbi:hypothetical protein D3C71_2099260 [compost metagenome]